MVFTCIAHLQANERGLLETDDAEYLHQARVALRRLRSALSVFNRAFPRASFEQQIAELRWLGGFLGPARDWDVFATETLPAVCAAFPGEAGLHWLIERTAELRAGCRCVRARSRGFCPLYCSAAQADRRVHARALVAARGRHCRGAAFAAAARVRRRHARPAAQRS